MYKYINKYYWSLSIENIPHLSLAAVTESAFSEKVCTAPRCRCGPSLVPSRQNSCFPGSCYRSKSSNLRGWIRAALGRLISGLASSS